VSSVAIGFAFKDILQNWLAGLLILIRQPFEIGDQIEVNGYEGRESIKIDGVESNPAPDVFAWDLAASWVTLRARWWTDSQRGNVVKQRSDVIRAVKHALDAAAIDMPYETKVHLFHDQTEETDGDRAGQREGWPSPKDSDAPKPRYQVTGKARSAGPSVSEA